MEVNSVLPGVKLILVLYKKLNLGLAQEEHYSQSLLELHLSVTLGSLALDLNLALELHLKYFPTL